MSKVGIIVPFRDRWEHYKLFKRYIVEYLDKNRYDYSLIVVEQDNSKSFNRGKLCNIGFLEAKSQGCSHTVFHDIDM
jgi:beta-1,4-galactosyltransferase 1